MRTSRPLALGILGLLFLNAGCNGGSSTAPVVPTPAPTPVPAPVLLRLIQGAPGTGTGAGGTVDVCVDTTPIGGGGTVSPSANYGGSTIPLALTNAPHTISVYPGIGATAGAQCATAPAAYLGTPPIATTILPPATNLRRTIVLGGTTASGTLGLYVFNEPTYATTPGGLTVITHNAAPAFSIGKANGVGFGICTTTVTPCTVATSIIGAQGRAIATVSTPSAAVINGYVASALTSIPAGMYDGIGVPAGTPVPITSIASPNPIPFQPYVVQLYAVDAPAGGLNLIAFVEQTQGFGF